MHPSPRPPDRRSAGPPDAPRPWPLLASDLELVSQWRLPAPPGPVWAALADPTTWPQWWPAAREVRTVRHGDADGVGQVVSLQWADRRLGPCVVEVEALQVPQWQRLRAHLGGAFEAQGLWLLSADAGHTRLTWVWRVHAPTAWPRLLAPFMRLLAWPLLWHRHRRVMREFEAGLRAHLAHAGDAATQGGDTRPAGSSPGRPA